MKKIIFSIIILLKLFILNEKTFANEIKRLDAQWTIIGAGPAGIATIGMLLDLGISQQSITWIDPEFNVGNLSSYSTVQANSKNNTYIKFLKACNTFINCVPLEIEKITQLEQDKESELKTIIEPLKELTKCLCKKVKTIKGSINSLYFEDNIWKIGVDNKIHLTYNVVLAIGGYPKTLNYNEFKNKEIPLQIALNQQLLKNYIKEDDIVAVIGSSHSAILILKYLSELNVKKIVNFYNKPIKYLIEIGNVIININGIKGATATWAKNVLEKNPPENIVRIESKDDFLNKILPECTKIIYAIGFDRNFIPNLSQPLKYDATTGIIAPRLFGIGMAFPEQYTEVDGKKEYIVGLTDFMTYALRVVPCWVNNIKKSKKDINCIKMLAAFNDLFTIQIL